MAASREKRKSSHEWEAGNSLKRRKTDGSEREAFLCINDLAEILDLLKRHRYSGTSYYELGLFLGLLPGTLDVIAKNHSGDVNAGLRECLKAWLQQADDVKSVGVPSYYSLIQALRKLGENAVADGIDREKHPACVIFTAQCESNECIVAALPSLAILLYKEKIIGTMLVPNGEVLLKAVKEAVCADYHNLEKFAQILKESQNTSSVGQCLLEEYKRLYPAGFTSINSDKEMLENKELEILQLMQRVQLLGSQFKKNTEKNIQMQQVNDAPYLEAKKVFLEHFIELSMAMAVTPNRLSVVNQLYSSGLISEPSFYQAARDDTVSGIESGILLMNDLKASIDQKPELISSLVAVLEGNEAFISVAKRIGRDIPPTLRMYYGQVLYEVKTPGVEWCMRIIFGRYLNTLEMYVKYRFTNAELGDSFSFTFNDADGYVELCFNETVHVPDGWSIRCHGSPLIASRHDIEEYGNMSPPQFPECCLITITATEDEETVEELNYPVTMRGVKSNVEEINIVLTSEPTAQEDLSTASDSSTQTSEPDDDEQKVILTIRNLVDVLRALKNHFPSNKWRKLGLYLGLLYDDLNVIEMTYPRDAERCLEECIARWLTDDNEPTWDKLATAAGEVGETTAAFYIENIL